MAVDDENTLHDDTIADAELVLRTRSGDAEAFGELWRRHYPSGMSVARSITSSIDADDLVQESYTRIYQAIIKGGGPNGSFRAYLFTSIRNTAAAWGRSRRESAIDELDSVADPDSTEQASNEALDRSLTAQAFRSLPSRWQEVLWYTEIEQMKPNEVAPLLGMKAGAVSQLAFRAREGLREAWIQAHLRSAEPGSECQWTIEHLGAYSRGNLGTRDHKRLEQHLDECARCMIVAAEAKDVSTRLALVLLPLVLGIAGSAGYLAALQGGGTPIVALAAMPSSVIQGGVVAGGATVGGVSAGSGSTGGSGAGSAGAGGSAGAAGSTAGGALTGIGALMGAGSAVLIVAGVVAASTILPALSGAGPATSLPDAAAADSSSSISTDIAPDDSMTTESPLIIETPPAEDPAPPATEPEEQPLVEVAPVTTAPTAPPVAPEKPTDPGTEPEQPVEPVDPVDPGPALPEGTPTVVATQVTCEADNTELFLVTHYRVEIHGEENATVQALLEGSSAGTTGTVLDAQGKGVVDLRPTFRQLVLDVDVQFQYTFMGADGVLQSGVLSDPVGLWDLANPIDVACGDETPEEATSPAPTDETANTPEAAPAEPAPVPGATTATSAGSPPAEEPASDPAASPAPADQAAPTEPAAPEQQGLVETVVDATSGVLDPAAPPAE